MAVNPLDPTQPVLLSQSIELVEELRAIKGRLVIDKDSITTLQNTLVDITGITAFGASLLASADSDAALDELDFTPVGKDLTQTVSLAALAISLGVQNFTPSISVGVGKTCITFVGGVKINMIQGAFADLAAHTWQVPFVTVIYGAATTLMQNNNDTVQIYNVTNAGCNVSFNGGGTKSYSVIAIGN